LKECQAAASRLVVVVTCPTSCWPPRSPGAAGCTAGSTTAAPASPVATSAPVAQTGLPAVIERLSPSVVTVRVGERLPAGPRPGSVGRMMTAWL